jgi:hypothetical protein
MGAVGDKGAGVFVSSGGAVTAGGAVDRVGAVAYRLEVPGITWSGASAEALNPGTAQRLALDCRSQNGGWLRREYLLGASPVAVAPASAYRNGGEGCQGCR